MKRILIIDDEADMQIHLGTLFRKAGYETAVADNGEDGLRKATASPPDLITLDLLMPRKSGVVAFEGLRLSPATREIPIIILTGLAQHDDLLRFGSPDIRPPEAVVDKPIDREAFMSKVKELMGEPD